MRMLQPCLFGRSFKIRLGNFLKLTSTDVLSGELSSIINKWISGYI